MKLNFAAAAALVFAAPAFAANPVVLDFETVTSFAEIAQYYNGGSDGSGSNTGPAYGVSFGGDALGLANDVLGPYFSNAPSPLGVMTPVGPAATMNVAGGFVDAVSFHYSAQSLVISAVEVWSGLDGSGSLLASFNLVANAQSSGCSDSPLCRFDVLSGSFAGTARSITFGAASGVAAFDNISITAVPEPTTAVMLAMGLASLMMLRRRG